MTARLRVAALRFGTVLGALLIIPFPLEFVPSIGMRVSGIVTFVWSRIDGAVGAMFGLDVARHPTGSGDTLADHVQLAICVAIAALVSSVWTLARPHTLAHPRLAAWARVVLRYYLAATMLSYGIAKVFPGQFGYAADTNLYAQIGQKSPMGMLWTFMGASRPYQIFGGAAECIGGLLLVSRRTTTLGALILLPVLSTVVALNFCYDVPVKLYSAELLLGTSTLLVPDARRLAAAVFARSDEPLFDGRRWRHAKYITLATGAMIALAATMSQVEPTTPTVYGMWDVSRFERDGVELPPHGIDPSRWKAVAIRSSAMIRTSDGEDHFHRVGGDETHLQLGEGGSEGTFAVTFHDDAPTLTGNYDHHPIVVELKRADPSQMPLITRGFHWIQEYPYNR